MTLQRPPASTQDTAIYKKISKITNDIDGLLGKASRFVEIATPMVDSIASGPFRIYTLHNRDHAKKLLHIAEYITSRDTIASLTPFECLLFLYSAYLHDMGMVVTDTELCKFVESDDFADVLNAWPQLRSNLNGLRTRLSLVSEEERPAIELAISEIHQIAATHYFRPRHATEDRYRGLLERIRSVEGAADLFQIRGISFADELIDICVSHNLSATVLGELRNAHEDRFERHVVVSGHNANTQFLAALLRLTDILDFERTPRVLFDSLGLKNRTFPGSEVSLTEWEKHMAVQQLEIRDSELLVRARCRHPAIEAAVRQFVQIIEEEIRTTLSVVKRNQQEIVDRYRFRLPSVVRCELRSDGYKFLDISLSLDESAVMSLLMGTSLYRTPMAAIRELIQNAVDACKVRQTLSSIHGTGSIQITDHVDDEGRRWIAVRDEGIGMDEYVLKSYFFKVGRSYYTSSDFERLIRSTGVPAPALASRFGIGFLACFMLADLVEIETTPYFHNSTSGIQKGLRVSIERLGALAYVQDVPFATLGTTIRLRLKQNLGDGERVCSEAADYIRATVVRSHVPISVMLSGKKVEIGSTNYFEVAKPLRAPKGIPTELLQVFDIPIHKYSDIFSGRVFLIFVANDDGTALDVRYGGNLLSLDTNRVGSRITIPRNYVFKEFEGNRVAVGGFRMQLSLGRLLRSANLVLPAAFDIDVLPGPHVQFDVARTRIIDDSMSLRQMLKASIQSAVKDLGVFSKVPDDVKRTLFVREFDDPFLAAPEVLRRRTELVLDEGLLSRVLESLPKDSWPVSVHRKVAADLGLSSGRVYHAISTLIIEGRISNPNLPSR